MHTILKSYKMNYFDAAENSNKVWIGLAFDDGTFESRFGRVRDGANLASKRKSLGSSNSAIHELERKRSEKLRKGYRDSATVSDGETIAVTGAQNLKQIAADQIAGSSCATTRELIEYLAVANIHNITTATSIKYNSASGAFSTPLGVLTPEAVKTARAFLEQIGNFNRNSSLRSSRRAEIVRDYFQLVPHDFGARIPKPETLLASAAAIKDESAILDALEAAFPTAASGDGGKVFECKLVKVPGSTDDGRATFRRVNELFKSTRNVHHAGTATRKMIKLYAVEIPAMKMAFDAAAAKFGNVRADLWHGSKASNLLSILKNGLIIPSASAAHCTGRMFGNGIYTSIQSTKALNYATNMWNSGGASNRTFMFLCEAALGKSYKPARSFSDLPPRGFNSTWVDAGAAGVMNHECIVYDTAQINLTYLAEFEL